MGTPRQFKGTTTYPARPGQVDRESSGIAEENGHGMKNVSEDIAPLLADVVACDRDTQPRSLRITMRRDCCCLTYSARAIDRLALLARLGPDGPA